MILKPTDFPVPVCFAVMLLCADFDNNGVRGPLSPAGV